LVAEILHEAALGEQKLTVQFLANLEKRITELVQRKRFEQMKKEGM
jgi:hypothetical protein